MIEKDVLMDFFIDGKDVMNKHLILILVIIVFSFAACQANGNPPEGWCSAYFNNLSYFENMSWGENKQSIDITSNKAIYYDAMNSGLIEYRILITDISNDYGSAEEAFEDAVILDSNKSYEMISESLSFDTSGYIKSGYVLKRTFTVSNDYAKEHFADIKISNNKYEARTVYIDVADKVYMHELTVFTNKKKALEDYRIFYKSLKELE